VIYEYLTHCHPLKVVILCQKLGLKKAVIPYRKLGLKKAVIPYRKLGPKKWRVRYSDSPFNITKRQYE